MKESCFKANMTIWCKTTLRMRIWIREAWTQAISKLICSPKTPKAESKKEEDPQLSEQDQSLPYSLTTSKTSKICFLKTQRKSKQATSRREEPSTTFKPQAQLIKTELNTTILLRHCRGKCFRIRRFSSTIWIPTRLARIQREQVRDIIITIASVKWTT